MIKFKECKIKDIKESFSSLIGEKYALVTVADEEKVNMMTASWGSMGILWNKNIVNMVIRPSRYTYDFMMKNDYFTLNFLSDGNEEIYKFCGTKSGRDYDKIAETGLVPVELKNSAFAFDKSEYVFVCKTLYKQPMNRECFNDADYAEKTYPTDDIHTMFIAEIEEIYVKDC